MNIFKYISLSLFCFLFFSYTFSSTHLQGKYVEIIDNFYTWYINTNEIDNNFISDLENKKSKIDTLLRWSSLDSNIVFALSYLSDLIWSTIYDFSQPITEKDNSVKLDHPPGLPDTFECFTWLDPKRWHEMSVEDICNASSSNNYSLKWDGSRYRFYNNWNRWKWNPATNKKHPFEHGLYVVHNDKAWYIKSDWSVWVDMMYDSIERWLVNWTDDVTQNLWYMSVSIWWAYWVVTTEWVEIVWINNQYVSDFYAYTYLDANWSEKVLLAASAAVGYETWRQCSHMFDVQWNRLNDNWWCISSDLQPNRDLLQDPSHIDLWHCPLIATKESAMWTPDSSDDEYKLVSCSWEVISNGYYSISSLPTKDRMIKVRDYDLNEKLIPYIWE